MRAAPRLPSVDAMTDFTSSCRHRRFPRPRPRARRRPGRSRISAHHRCPRQRGARGVRPRRIRAAARPATRDRCWRCPATSPILPTAPTWPPPPPSSAAPACWSTTPARWAPARCRRWPTTRSKTCVPSLEVNVVAPLALTQLLLPDLRARGGAVLSVTSDAAVEAYAGWGGYGAAKAALEQACNVLAAEEPAVRVWWVDPGDMRTADAPAGFPGEDISDRPLPEAVAAGVPAAHRRADAERPVPGRGADASADDSAAGVDTVMTVSAQSRLVPEPAAPETVASELRPELEAHEPPEVARQRPGRRPAARQPDRRRRDEPPRVRRPAGPAAAGRPRRREQLGHAARRGRRGRSPAEAGPLTVHFSTAMPTATGWSSCAPAASQATVPLRRRRRGASASDCPAAPC